MWIIGWDFRPRYQQIAAPNQARGKQIVNNDEAHFKRLVGIKHRLVA